MTEYIKTPELTRETQVLGLRHETTVVPDNFVGAVELKLGSEEAGLRVLRVADLPRDDSGNYLYDGSVIDPGAGFLIVADSVNDDGNVLQSGGEPQWSSGFKELYLGDQVGLGRERGYGASDNFPLLQRQDVSRRHATVSVNGRGRLVISDHSLNGTGVSYDSFANVESGQGVNSEEWNSLLNYDAQKPVVGVEQFSKRVRRLAAPLSRDLSGRLFDQGDTGVNSNIPKRERVSDASIGAARDQLNQIGRNHLFREITGYDGVYSDEMINELRRNHGLRCQLLEMFTGAIHDVQTMDPNSLAERVRLDSPDNLKEANNDGYSNIGKMRSSEYVALLMLSMLDASFDPGRADNVQSHINRDGSPGFGQHREAAKRAFDYLKYQ